MFGLLAPAALAGLALLSIPILLHIFKPRKVRQTPFSSLRWLRASQHRLSRRIKWHQVLLFALRAAFIILIVLALAKPIFSPGKETAQAERFVILDATRSMAYRQGNEPVAFERGKQVAEQVVSSVVAGDRTALLLAGGEPEVLGPLTSNAQVYLPRLRHQEAQAADANLTDTLGLIQPMLANQREGAMLDLYFITDNQAQNWSQGPIARFLADTDAKVRVNVIDVGPGEAMANAWVADARLTQSADIRADADAGPKRTLRVQVGAVGREVQERTVKLTGLPGLPELTQQVVVPSGQFRQAMFELPPDYSLQGKVAQVVLEPADGLTSDDTFWLNLDRSGAMRVLVIEPASTQIAELQPGFHLRSAIGALADAAQGGIEVIRQSPDALLGDEITRADLVLMVDVPAMPQSNVQALERRVQEGAGLVVFLGPSADPSFYNTLMHDPLRPGGSLLPVKLGQRTSVAGNDLLPMTNVQWQHRLFTDLSDPVYSDLARTRFEAYYELESDDASLRGQVLASIDGRQPAMLEATLGAGKVILMNTTANDAWSNLPRRKSFVPLVDRLLTYLTGGVHRGTFAVGEVAILPLLDATPEPAVTVTAPGGQAVTPVRRTIGGRPYIQLDNLRQAGVYEVAYDSERGKASFPFVVQPGGHDSLLLPAEEDTLRSWWQPAEFQVIRPDAATGEIELPSQRILLEPWLVALACAFLLAEMFFVHWLCPKMNPSAVAGSVVSRRGFFNRGTEGVDASGGGAAAKVGGSNPPPDVRGQGGARGGLDGMTPQTSGT